MQSLKAFQTAFKVDVVRVGLEEFAKDGAVVELINAVNKWVEDHPKEAAKEEIEAVGDSLYFKPPTSSQRAGFEASIVGADGKQRNMQNLYARYVALCWTDEIGTPIATAKQAGDMAAAPLAELFTKIQELNGVKTDAVEEAGKD